jgi:hypothetical protein
VQTSLETASAQVLVATLTYSGEDANYYCTGIDDHIFLITAGQYLSEVFNGGKIRFTDGIYDFPDFFYTPYSGIFYQGTGKGSIFRSISGAAWCIFGTVTSYLEDISIENISFDMLSLSTRYLDRPSIQNIFIDTDLNSLLFLSCRYSFISNCHIIRGNQGIWTSGQYNIIENNSITSCSAFGIRDSGINSIIKNNLIVDSPDEGIIIEGNYANIGSNQLVNNATWRAGTYISRGININAGAIGNRLTDNCVLNCGNLIDRSVCDNSSTSPMIFGEAAPTSSNCTWGFTSTGPYEGTGQYRFTKSVAAGTKAWLHLVDNVGAADLHGMIPGTQYEWSGWFKASSSGSAGYQGPRIYQVTTGGGAASATAVTVATASWQWVAVTATIYANATTAYIGFWASSSLGNAHIFDVDNVRLFPPGTTNVHNQNFYDAGTNTYVGL